jgi:[acyl-carrier-protein] S-malonyltransferase
VSYAVLFPGQGSQFVGMGADLFDAHPDLLGERSNDQLGWSLRDLCLDGPEELLTRTEYAQPALFALSFALWSSFSSAIKSTPAGVAGHSLGEYTALAAAQVLGYSDGLALVASRGKLMADAADATASGMAALMGVDVDLTKAIINANEAEGGSLQIANINAPGQIVVAGSEADLEWLANNGKALGLRRSIPLKVAGAFHSSYMTAAADGLKPQLTDVTYGESRFPVWANTTAQPYRTSQVAETLLTQITSPVLFESTLLNMSESSIGTFVHIGPGDVTAGLARRTLPEAVVHTVSTMEDIEPAAHAVGTM